MKWVLNPCRRHRRDLSLLASGLLPEPERAGIENHLATCADCRSYFDQIRMMTVSLADWERHFEHVEPTSEIQNRWAKFIQVAADVNRREQPVRELTFAATLENAVRLSFLELVWPCRRIWAGLAAVWVLLLVANISMHDSSQIMVAKTSPTPEMILSFRQQEKILAELIGPNETRAAVPRKPFTPQPSSERRFENLMT